MAKGALVALIPFAFILTGCQTLNLSKRVEQAAQTQGKASARLPRLVLPAACTALTERVKVRDEAWVIHTYRWNVAADNRDQLAKDCQAWADDWNKRLASG